MANDEWFPLTYLVDGTSGKEVVGRGRFEKSDDGGVNYICELNDRGKELFSQHPDVFGVSISGNDIDVVNEPPC